MILCIRDSIIAGIVWSFTYLFIRKYMNPSTSDFYMDFAEDAVYGGLAVTVNMLIIIVLYKYVLSSSVCP